MTSNLRSTGTTRSGNRLGVCTAAACRQGIAVAHISTDTERTETEAQVHSVGLIPWMGSSLLSAATQGRELARKITEQSEVDMWVIIPDHADTHHSWVCLGGLLAAIPEAGGHNPDLNVYEHTGAATPKSHMESKHGALMDKALSHPCLRLVLHVSFTVSSGFSSTVDQIIQSASQPGGGV